VKEQADWIRTGLALGVEEAPFGRWFFRNGKVMCSNVIGIMLAGKLGSIEEAQQILLKTPYGNQYDEIGPWLQRLLDELKLNLLQLQKLARAHAQFSANQIADRLERGEYYEDGREYFEEP
jgi:hypothetical protein